MPKIIIDLPYEAIERIARNYPGLPIEVAIRQFIVDALGGDVQLIQPTQDSGKIQKMIQDMINPFTAKVDELARRLGDVIDILDNISDKIKELEEEVKVGKSRAEVQVGVVAQQAKEAKKSAIDVLKDQKVMYEKDIATRIRNRDAFFDKLRREGAIVLEVKGQRIAIEPGYWKEFKEVLQKLNTSNESEIKEVIGKVGYSLLRTLWEGGVIYFDAVNKKWRFAEELG